MQVMIEVTNPLAREQTMTKVQDKAKVVAIKELLERDEDFVRSAGLASIWRRHISCSLQRLSNARGGTFRE
jgi:hypothetical protein